MSESPLLDVKNKKI